MSESDEKTQKLLDEIILESPPRWGRRNAKQKNFMQMGVKRTKNGIE